MRLRLLMPSVDRLLRGGSIVRWHKSEGEWVDYGDDLFDLHVPIRRPEYGGDVLVRVTSSDAGLLRRIYAREGGRHEVGDLLAVLVTGDTEPVPEDPACADGTVFRVVTSVL